MITIEINTVRTSLVPLMLPLLEVLPASAKTLRLTVGALFDSGSDSRNFMSQALACGCFYRLNPCARGCGLWTLIVSCPRHFLKG